MAEEKTNVMRLLEQKKIPFTSHYYQVNDGAVDGVTVAEMTGQNPEQVFKSLVTRGGKGFYVFVIPVASHLDLKAAAKVAGEKSIEMLKQVELLPLTGYVHGGCSPVGMKKQFKTFFDESAQVFPTILVSGGKIGTQVELSPEHLAGLTRGRFAALQKNI